MKHFLIVLFGVIISTFCSAQVNISSESAVYHLQAVEHNKNCNAQLAEKNIQIQSLQEQNAAKDEMIKEKETSHAEFVEFTKSELVVSEEEKKILRKEVKRQKFQKVIIMVGSVIIIILVAV